MQPVCATELDGHRTGNATGARPVLAPHRVWARPWARWPRFVTLTLTLCASIVWELASLTACESVPSHAAATRTVPSPMQSLTPYPTPTASTPTVLTPPPQDCPASQATQTVLPDGLPVMGHAPVWSTCSTPLHIPSYDTYTRFGWTLQIIWVAWPSYT